MEADSLAKRASRQLHETVDTAPTEPAGDKNFANKIARKRCNESPHFEFVDVEISETISKLEYELNEFYDMKLEHQKKLAEICAISMQTDITISNCQDLGNFNETTTTMMPEPPPARTDTHCSTVSNVRGCAQHQRVIGKYRKEIKELAS